MSIKGYWAATLDCGCAVSLDYGEYVGDVVVDGGRITSACTIHSIGQSIAELKSAEQGEVW